MAKTRSGPRKRSRAASDPAPPGTWQPRLHLWVHIQGSGSLGPGKLRLLDIIASTKSLSAAARELDMSYRLAWQHLRLLEQHTGMTVVEPRRGGRSGGGTTLTPEGAALVKAYRDWRAEVEKHSDRVFARRFKRWSAPGSKMQRSASSPQRTRT